MIGFHFVAPRAGREMSMPRPDTIALARIVSVSADFNRRRVVISCETENREPVRLEVGFKALEELHEKIEKQLELL